MGEVGLLLGLRGKALHLLCASNGVPVSYELTPANAAEVYLTTELLAEAGLGEEVGRRLLGASWPTGARGWRRSWPRWESCW